MVHGDNAGGCYHKLPSAEDPTKPWTENVRETEILATLEWGTCEDEECKYHMGDGQWEDVEAAFNNAFEANNPAAYPGNGSRNVSSRSVSMPLAAGKYLTCQGTCGFEFFSQSGTSTHCIECREQ